MSKKQKRKIRKLRARVKELEATIESMRVAWRPSMRFDPISLPEGTEITSMKLTADGWVSVPSIWTEPVDVPSSVTTTSDDGVMDFSVPAWPSATSTAPIIETDGKYVWVNADGQRRRHSRASGTEDEEE